MPRCRCVDISNAESDLKRLATIRDHIGEAWLATASTKLGQLSNNILNGATPNNVFLFQNIDDKLEKPTYDRLRVLYNKCVSRLGVLPGQIQSLKTEDKTHHDAMALMGRRY